MTWGWWLVAAVVVVMAVVLLSPVRVRVEYRHIPPAADALAVKVSLLWGALHLGRTVDLTRTITWAAVKGEEETAELAHQAKEVPARLWDEYLAGLRHIVGRVRRYARAFQRYARALQPPAGWFLRKIKPVRISGSIEIGLGDAAVTGLAIGALWAVLGSAVAWAKNRPNGRDFRATLRIKPDFRQPGLAADVYCIFAFKTAHAILAAIYAGWQVLRKWHTLRKGVVARGRTSDPGFNEDGHGEYQGHD